MSDAIRRTSISIVDEQEGGGEWSFQSCQRNDPYQFTALLGILEFNPQLAGQDVTPANLEFGSVSSRRRERREKSVSTASGLPGAIQTAATQLFARFYLSLF